MLWILMSMCHPVVPHYPTNSSSDESLLSRVINHRLATPNKPIFHCYALKRGVRSGRARFLGSRFNPPFWVSGNSNLMDLVSQSLNLG